MIHIIANKGVAEEINSLFFFMLLPVIDCRKEEGYGDGSNDKNCDSEDEWIDALCNLRMLYVATVLIFTSCFLASRSDEMLSAAARPPTAP